SMLPRRMIEPLPNCFSICENARSIALFFSILSSVIFFFLFSQLFSPLQISVLNQAEFFADQSVEWIGASGFLGKTTYALAVACFARVQGLSRLEALLGFSHPVHFQTKQSKLIERFVEMWIHLRGMFQMLDGALVLAIGVVNRSQQKMDRGAGFQFQCLGKMLQSLLAVADTGEQRSQRCVRG